MASFFPPPLLSLPLILTFFSRFYAFAILSSRVIRFNFDDPFFLRANRRRSSPSFVAEFEYFSSLRYLFKPQPRHSTPPHPMHFIRRD
uniref:Putative secreted protein n=1 Tax=Anopheles darlingi TaxID=43151 RepID=A0A2M4DAR6_ANODA